MKNLIKNILSEDLDWVKKVPGTPRGFEIIEPKSNTNPKNVFMIYITHAHGEEGGVWADNWFSVKENESDRLIYIANILSILQGQREPVHKLVEKVMEGETWILSPMTWLPKEDYDDEDAVYDVIHEYFWDFGVLSFDSYYQEEALLERWWIIYFDGNGIEHKVNIDRDTVWAQRR